MALFKSKKYLDKQAQARQAELSEEQRREDAEDFKLRDSEFIREYVELVKRHHVDFGIRWGFDPIRGPQPMIARVDMKRFHEEMARRGDGLIKGDQSGLIKPTDPVEVSAGDKLDPQ